MEGLKGAELSPERLSYIAEICNRLTFVKWDRFAGAGENDDRVDIYGWIDRLDTHSDFVVLQFIGTGVGYCTSSAEYTNEINRLIFGNDATPEFACERVEGQFAGLITHLIKLPTEPRKCSYPVD